MTKPLISQLSILIPTFNSECTELVSQLQSQAEAIPGLDYEILVADDGSTDTDKVEANLKITEWPHCRYLIRKENVGRAAIRNFLARSSRYDHLLFIDSHMSVISDHFLHTYLSHPDDDLVYGGYAITCEEKPHGNLRYLYEMSCIESQRHDRRAQSPYANFHTSNFMVRRRVMLSYPLDERFKRYGYEDVLWGKTLKSAGIRIIHIDNPVGFNHFESNSRFMEKTEEGLQTLYDFRKDLSGYSRLLSVSHRLHQWHVDRMVRCVYGWSNRLLRKNLTGANPSLSIFKLYRLGYYLNISR